MNADTTQAEHDISVLRMVITDLHTDIRTPDGHRAIVENGHLIENALDDLSLLVEKIRRASTSHVVRSIPITIQAAE